MVQETKKHAWVRKGQTFMIVDHSIGLGGRYDVVAETDFNFTMTAAEFREQAPNPIHAQDGREFVNWLIGKGYVSNQPHPPYFLALDTGHAATFGK